MSLSSGVDDGYQLTQKQAAFAGDELTRRVDSVVSCWVKRRPGILLGYVWVEDWWVSYLWQGKVHLQVLIMVGLLDMKMNKHT